MDTIIEGHHHTYTWKPMGMGLYQAYISDRYLLEVQLSAHPEGNWKHSTFIDEFGRKWNTYGGRAATKELAMAAVVSTVERWLDRVEDWASD